MKKLLLLLSLTSISTQSLALWGPATKGLINLFDKFVPQEVQDAWHTFIAVFGYILLLLGFLGFLYLAYLKLLDFLGKGEEKNLYGIENFLFFLFFLALGLLFGYMLFSITKSLF